MHFIFSFYEESGSFVRSDDPSVISGGRALCAGSGQRPAAFCTLIKREARSRTPKSFIPLIKHAPGIDFSVAAF